MKPTFLADEPGAPKHKGDPAPFVDGGLWLKRKYCRINLSLSGWMLMGRSQHKPLLAALLLVFLFTGLGYAQESAGTGKTTATASGKSDE